jgi:hypothetical protein
MVSYFKLSITADVKEISLSHFTKLSNKVSFYAFFSNGRKSGVASLMVHESRLSDQRDCIESLFYLTNIGYHFFAVY